MPGCLEDIYNLFKNKYRDTAAAALSYSNFEFWTTDKIFKVRHKIVSLEDIREGAVVEVIISAQVAKKKRKREDDYERHEPKRIRDSPKPKRFVLRLRDLPLECTVADIEEFFKGINLVETQIVFKRNGQSSGEAFIQLYGEDDLKRAMSKNNENLGDRYIEILESTPEKMDKTLGRYQQANEKSFIIRIKGLPLSAKEQDIIEFFRQANVRPEHVQLVFETNDRGLKHPSGRAFAWFKTLDDIQAALACRMKKIGSRHIKLKVGRVVESKTNLDRREPYSGRKVKSNKTRRLDIRPDTKLLERKRAKRIKPSPRDGRSNVKLKSVKREERAPRFYREHYEVDPNDNCILMRGLPYDCKDREITVFFHDCGVTPVRIYRSPNTREAYVEFSDGYDARGAMFLNKAHMGRCYISLFRVSYQEMADVVGIGRSPHSSPRYSRTSR